jgi:galactose oxidase
VQPPKNADISAAQILLPDARVFTGGGGLCGTACPSDGANHDDGEIFSPPYLFNADETPATRPNITSAPTSATYGAVLMVTTDSNVTAFSMIRVGCAAASAC